MCWPGIFSATIYRRRLEFRDRGLRGGFSNMLSRKKKLQLVAALATLCIHHEKELEQTPITDDTPPVPGRVAEIV